MTLLDETSLRDILRDACAEAGSQQAWADQHELSTSYVTDVLRGRRGFGQAILDALGYERIIGFKKLDSAA